MKQGRVMAKMMDKRKAKWKRNVKRLLSEAIQSSDYGITAVVKVSLYST